MHNKITAEGFASLLRNNHNLLQLYLGFNKIDITNEVVEAWSSLGDHVLMLYLRNNEITDDGIKNLYSLKKGCGRRMNLVSFQENEKITDASVLVLIYIRQQEIFSWMDIYKTKITIDGEKKMRKADIRLFREDWDNTVKAINMRKRQLI